MFDKRLNTKLNWLHSWNCKGKKIINLFNFLTSRARDLIHHNTMEHSEAVKNTPANLGNKRGNYERTYREKVTKTKDK